MDGGGNFAYVDGRALRIVNHEVQRELGAANAIWRLDVVVFV